MSRVCPQCSQEFSPERRYCTACLARLEARQTTPPARLELDLEGADDGTSLAQLRLLRCGVETGHVTPLAEDMQRVGRDSGRSPEGVIVGLRGINDFEGLHISRFQAFIGRDKDERWYVLPQPRSVHLITRNGVIIEARTVLEHGDIIGFGGVDFRFTIETLSEIITEDLEVVDAEDDEDAAEGASADEEATDATD